MPDPLKEKELLRDPLTHDIPCAGMDELQRTALALLPVEELPYRSLAGPVQRPDDIEVRRQADGNRGGG
jgi:hypothetical protein